MTLSVTVNGVDLTAYLDYASLAVKLNTADLSFTDPVGGPIATGALGLAVVITSPGDFPQWSGTIGNYTLSDIVTIQSGHYRASGTAVNTTAAVAATAPFDLSDS